MIAHSRKKLDSKSKRKITRDEHEGARSRHRDRMKTATSKERYKKRQHFGETPFAILKSYFGLRRFLLRGHKGVQTEFQWTCTTFNVKKMRTLMAR